MAIEDLAGLKKSDESKVLLATEHVQHPRSAPTTSHPSPGSQRLVGSPHCQHAGNQPPHGEALRARRTRIQLPDELYQQAKAFAAQRELSLAEVTRRGLELFLDRFPNTEPARGAWTLPRVDAGGIKVLLETLRDIAADDESKCSLADR